MSRLCRFVPAFTVVLGFAPACSHEPKPVPVSAAAAATRPAAARPPAPRPPLVVRPTVVDVSKNKEDVAIFFDFDSDVLRDEARPVLQKVADEMRGGRGGIRVEGNCDELGTVEYNLALGERRAQAAKEYLTHLGVPPTKIDTISYGSQRPRYAGHDDGARARNRRDDFIIR